MMLLEESDIDIQISEREDGCREITIRTTEREETYEMRDEDEVDIRARSGIETDGRSSRPILQEFEIRRYYGDEVYNE